MICFCGNSYIEEKIPKPQKSWVRLLTNKLYVGDYEAPIFKSIKYSLNIAAGGTSIDNLIEDQLIKRVLPYYPDKPFEYLIISITYNERFSLLSNVSFIPGNSLEDHLTQIKTLNKSFGALDDNKLISLLNSQIDYKLIADYDIFLRRKNLLSNLTNFFAKFGTKILVFNVDTARDYYVNETYYCNKKSIINYINPANNSEDYSNHFSLENNRLIAETFYNELINKQY